MRSSRAARRLVVAVLCVAAAGVAQARPLRVRLTPFTVEPQSERQPCEYLALANSTPMDVRELRVDAGRGLHHILVYAYQGDDRDPRWLTHGVRDQAECSAVGPPGLFGAFVGLTGAARAGTYRLPPGQAVSLGAGQPLWVQTHVFNATRSKRIRSAVKLRFVEAKRGTVVHHLQPIDATAEAFEIPPAATAVFTGDFVAPFDVNVAMVSSHQHQMGTRAVITPVIDGVVGEPIYENRRWSEPHLRWLDPALHLRAGDRLRMRCEWFNTTDHVIRHGPSAADEMCNLNGYFFHDVEIPLAERRTLGGHLSPVSE